MKTIYAALFALLLTMGFTLGHVNASTIAINVLEDGYFFTNPNIMNWYNTAPYAKSFNFSGDHDEDPATPDVNFSTQGYFKYDIGSLVSSGITASDVTSASMKFYLREKGGMSPDPVALGASGILQIDPYATAPDFTPYGGSLGSKVSGYTQSQLITLGVDVTTGATQLVSIDITDIVKGWLKGSFANYGIEMIYPTLNTGDTFYWATMEDDGISYGDITPFLEVNTVPIPSAILLFASGLIGFIGIRRRKI